jgi:hypothetical protein
MKIDWTGTGIDVEIVMLSALPGASPKPRILNLLECSHCHGRVRATGLGVCIDCLDRTASDVRSIVQSLDRLIPPDAREAESGA